MKMLLILLLTILTVMPAFAEIEVDNACFFLIKEIKDSHYSDYHGQKYRHTINSSSYRQYESSGSCFSGDTKILAADYRKIKLLDLTVGEIITSYNIISKSTEESTVTEITAHLSSGTCQLELESGKTVRVTPNHLFYSPSEKGWFSIGEFVLELIPPKVYILDKNTGDIKVDKITGYTDMKDETVYSIEVEPEHNYFANDIFVHNKVYVLP